MSESHTCFKYIFLWTLALVPYIKHEFLTRVGKLLAVYVHTRQREKSNVIFTTHYLLQATLLLVLTCFINFELDFKVMS